MMMKPIKFYYSRPTQKKWRKIGDTILIGTTSVSAFMMSAPLSENAKSWTIFVLNIIGVVGKVVSNMFKEEDDPESKTN